MRLAFMGTPDFAVASLAELIASGHEIVAVYSQPPRPKGRGQKLTPSPVHAFAESMGLPVFTPENLKAEEAIEVFESLDLDAACVVAYGQILKARVLDAPRLGCFNLHGSLLPRWRGAAPIQRAIMAGDAQTGVQIMRMSEGLDEGPILLGEIMDIYADDTAQSLSERMSHVGAALWPRALAALERGGATETAQSGEPVYARKITSEEARIDWTRSAAEVDAHIRGLSPFPGAWFEAPSEAGENEAGPVRIKVLMSAVAEGSGEPGQVLEEAGLTIACASGAVRLVRVQRQGKAAQGAEDLLTIEYDGTAYNGFQAQEGQPTVQGALEAAILGFSGEAVRIAAAGRTDTGVHATAQVVHVDLARDWPVETVLNAMNAHLVRDDVCVLKAEPSPDADWHARFSATGRGYLYRILNRRPQPVLERDR
ncbi:hypothetical protein LTR94_026811, partial [Friedmanniomyces endolithicus]